MKTEIIAITQPDNETAAAIERARSQVLAILATNGFTPGIGDVRWQKLGGGLPPLESYLAPGAIIVAPSFAHLFPDPSQAVALVERALAIGARLYIGGIASELTAHLSVLRVLGDAFADHIAQLDASREKALASLEAERAVNRYVAERTYGAAVSALSDAITALKLVPLKDAAERARAEFEEARHGR